MISTTQGLHKRRAALLALASAAYLAGPHAAFSADGTWNVNANGDWNTANTTPWQGSTIASGSDAAANFKYDITGSRIVTLTENMTIGSVHFDDLTPSNDWTLARTGSAVLTLQTTTPTAPIISVAGGSSRSATISAVLSGNQGFTKDGTGKLILSGPNTTTGGFTGTVTVNAGKLDLRNDNAVGNVHLASTSALLDAAFTSSGTVNINGSITGTGKIDKTSGVSTMVLNGAGTHSGGTTLSDGHLVIGTGTNYGLGTGTLELKGGSLSTTDNGLRTISNALVFGSNSVRFGALQDAATGKGDLTFTYDPASALSIGGGKNWTVNNGTTVRFSNDWSGNGGWNITKLGTGALVFDGSITSSTSVGLVVNAGTFTLNGTTNNYSGATTVNGGTLLINGSKTGAGAVTVAENALLGGTGSISGAVTLNGDGADTDLFGGGIKPLSATDPLAITGSLTLGAGSVLDLGALGGLDPATTYTILQYAGTPLTGGFTVQNPVATHQVSYDFANEIRLIPVPEPGTIALAAATAGLSLLARKRRA